MLRTRCCNDARPTPRPPGFLVRPRVAAKGWFAVAFGLLGCEPNVLGPHAATPSPTVAAASFFPLQVLVDDPVADNTGSIDVIAMALRFDNESGAYELELTASASAPFSGSFRININLYNAGVAAFFHDALNDYTLVSPVTTIILAGTSSALRAWSAGDLIHTNRFFGDAILPTVSQFRSSVTLPPFTFLTNEDMIAFPDRLAPAVVEPVTPEAALQQIITEIDALVTAGVISRDQAAGLNDKLIAVIAKISAGHTRAAINQLNSFVNQVTGLMNSGLDAAVGQALIASVRVVIGMLSP